MSVARITSGVLAGSRDVDRCGAAATMRKAPPVPVTVSWQPAPAQVLVVDATLAIGSCARKIGLMHFWKYANERCWLP